MVWASLAVAIIGFGSTAVTAGMEPSRFRDAGPRFADLLRHLLTPPDWQFMPTLGGGLLETVGMAFLASAVAILIATPLSILMARNTTPSLFIAYPLRILAAILRAIPDLLWALAFVAAVGLGPVPGIAALVVTTIAYLAKFHQESLDVVANGPIEGIASVGASGFARRWFGVLPQAVPDFVGQWVYSLDSNVRAATILGIVGAGGVGFDLSNAVKLQQYDRLGPLILSFYIIVTILDRLSDRLRRRVI
jgi:phosphonate transport system permease protein